MAKGFSPTRELRFVKRSDGKITVAINLANSYETSLLMANTLDKELTATLPECCRPDSLSDIVILGGDHRAGMLSIQMIIKPVEAVTVDELVGALRAKNFIEGMEPSAA